MERIVAGLLETRRVVTEKEKRILAYREASHALMSHLVGDPQPVQKVTIVSRGRALSYTLHAQEGRYLPYEGRVHRPDEGDAGESRGRADRVRRGHERHGERPRARHRACRSVIFEFRMGEEVASRTVRADNCALSKHAKQFATRSQARLPTDLAPSRRFAR